jgi:hypothetical protein
MAAVQVENVSVLPDAMAQNNRTLEGRRASALVATQGELNAILTAGLQERHLARPREDRPGHVFYIADGVATPCQYQQAQCPYAACPPRCRIFDLRLAIWDLSRTEFLESKIQNPK